MSAIDQEFGQQDYELKGRESCYSGFFKLDKFRFRHKRFDGDWSRDIDREVFVRGDATCVLPYDPVAEKVVLLEQFRVGALLSEKNPWLIELVAGINEAGEEPEDVASREAVEEAGLTLKALEPICEYFPSPGGTCENVHLYCALVDSQGVGGLYGLPEEDEDIKVHVIDVHEIAGLLASGLVNNSPAIIALQWLLLNKARLQEKWSDMRT